MSVQSRLHERKFAKHFRDYQNGPRPKRIARFLNGRVYVGTASGHRHPAARKIALLVRIKNYTHKGYDL